MASIHKLALLLSLFIISIITAATCSSDEPCKSFMNFPNNAKYATCKDLPVLDSSLHWNYHQSSSRVDVAFKKSNAKDSSWIAWAVNPTSQGMAGSQAFIAFRNSSDATLRSYTSPITGYHTFLQQGSLSFPVYAVSASYHSNGDMIIFASFKLPEKQVHKHHHSPHGCIGITLICLASLQVLVAVFFRPKKDHKYRIFWNMFHYVVGYGTIGLAIWNVFKGIDIMEERKWRSVYLALVICLAVIAFVLELVTWILLCIKRKVNNHDEDQLDDDVDQRIP
ncbi:hypothetical protein PIB30_045753 [Stylosanthes scabra]|uniref:Cytochrome b561 and DOMON domain-containing protein n=1 Tax=Stylosanthes scabra TaxID=79078 RepID=A0ABU6RGY9_9FABA|nr:hypothetical protein [Stylosanthes scabra]